MVLGAGLMVLGVALNIIGTLGILRFPNYFIRLHAATVAVIGGCVLPLVGISILAFGMWEDAGVVTSLGAIATATFIFLTVPVSSHAVARAATKMKIDRAPLYHDHLKEDKE
jgi:multicomponent Na+:H+ antiporter subunit G